MKPVSFKRHRFSPIVIRHAVWPYYRFTMSLRDDDDLLAKRGINVSYETVRCWANKFGPAIAGDCQVNLGKVEPPPWRSDTLRPRPQREFSRQEVTARSQNYPDSPSAVASQIIVPGLICW
jgi:hypothetical protein